MQLYLFHQYCPNLVTTLINVIRIALKIPDFDTHRNRVKFECYCRTIALIWSQVRKHLEPLISSNLVTNESSVEYIQLCISKCTDLTRKRRRKRHTHDFWLTQLALNKVWKELEIGNTYT